MSDIDHRLTVLEQRFDRHVLHMNRVMSAQRERVDKGFDQIHIALLEVMTQMSLIRETLSEQQRSLRKHRLRTRKTLHEIIQIIREMQSPPPAA